MIKIDLALLRSSSDDRPPPRLFLDGQPTQCPTLRAHKASGSGADSRRPGCSQTPGCISHLCIPVLFEKIANWKTFSTAGGWVQLLIVITFQPFNHLIAFPIRNIDICHLSTIF